MFSVLQSWQFVFEICVHGQHRKTRRTLHSQHLARSVTKWNTACGSGVGTIDTLHESHETLQASLFCCGQQFWSAHLDHLSTHLLLEVYKISNQLQAECCAYLEHKRLFRFLVCARSKQPCLTAVPNQKLILWTQV